MEKTIEISKFEYLKNKFSGIQYIIVKYLFMGVILFMNVLFFTSNTNDEVGIVTQAIRAIGTCVIQLGLPGMIYCGYIKISDRTLKLNSALRILCIIIWVLCLYFSTMALKGYTLEQAQKTKNNIYYNSEEYKSSKSEIDSLKEQLKLKNDLLKTENENYKICVGSDTENKQANNNNWNDLNTQIKQKESQISNLNKQIDTNKQAGLKETGTTIINLKNEIKKLESDKKQLITSRDSLTGNKAESSNIIQTRIDKINNEIVELQNKINDKDKNIITQKTTTKKKTSYDFAFGSSAELATTIFYYLFEAIYLLLCIITNKSIKEDKIKYYKVEIDNIEPLKLNKFNDLELKHLETNNNLVTFDEDKELRPVKANLKAHKAKSNIEEDEDFLKYYECMINNLNQEKECLGYTKISKLIGIKEHKAKKIFGHLEKLGIIAKHNEKRNKSIFVKELY